MSFHDALRLMASRIMFATESDYQSVLAAITADEEASMIEPVNESAVSESAEFDTL